MKDKPKKSFITIIGVTLILIAVLARRLYVKSYPIDATLSFLAGFAVIILCGFILKIVLKNKK